MIKIGKAIGGISLNGIEWLLDSEGNEMHFEGEAKAITFLRESA